jgi:hypothetical protein
MSTPHSSEPGEATTEAAPPARVAASPARPDYTVASPPAASPSAGKPRIVVLAFSVWISSFLAGLVAVAYSLSSLDELRGALQADVRAQRPQIAADALDRVVRATLNVGLAGVTGMIVLQLMLVLLVLGRHNWARILLTVMGGLGILATAFALVTFAERTQVLLAAQAVLIVGATVLMFLPSANTWFRNHSGRDHSG